MSILNLQVEAYIEQLNKTAFIEDEEILKEMEDYAYKNDFPIIDRTVGRLVYLLTKLKNPKLVVELGSGYGYSAYYFAKAMNDGKVILTDYQEKNLSMAKSYFERFGLLNKAEFKVGNAIEIAKQYKDIDILFMDLEKTKYLEAILTLKDNLKVGSLVIADNTLWYGKVALDNPDEKTAKIREFNEYMFKSEEFFSVLIPLRDGILISSKIK